MGGGGGICFGIISCPFLNPVIGMKILITEDVSNKDFTIIIQI